MIDGSSRRCVVLWNVEGKEAMDDEDDSAMFSPADVAAVILLENKIFVDSTEVTRACQGIHSNKIILNPPRNLFYSSIMTITTGTLAICAALAIAAPTGVCFVAQRPHIHHNNLGRSYKTKSETSSKPFSTSVII